MISSIIEDIEIDFPNPSLESPPGDGASRTTVCGWVVMPMALGGGAACCVVWSGGGLGCGRGSDLVRV